MTQSLREYRATKVNTPASHTQDRSIFQFRIVAINADGSVTGDCATLVFCSGDDNAADDMVSSRLSRVR